MTTRRNLLRSALFGAGFLGLRSLATGIPVSILSRGKDALADEMCSDASKAQFMILATSGNGDPLNANAPGTYFTSGPMASISHNQDPTMVPGSITLGGKGYTAAQPWTTKFTDPNILNRMTVWHMMTNTPVHPKEPDVLCLMDQTAPKEMLPSLLARQLAPCLGTIQNQPITLGATSPSEGLSFQGQALPIIPPLALKSTLTNPMTGQLAGVTSLQSLRDDTLSKINDIYRGSATKAQKAYLDSVITSQSQIRAIDQKLLDQLSSITDNSVASQVKAAVVLIQMAVTPVIAIHIPFGGDNHNDTLLATEALQTNSGLQTIADLMTALQGTSNAKGTMFDQVSFASLNVFGRTLAGSHTDGRDHNPNHQVSITIGKGFAGGVLGGLQPIGSDFGCTDIGSVKAVDTLASYGKTLMTAVGIDEAYTNKVITSGSVITGALAP
ncbi:MAG: hypothetical protein QM831_19260 [Kofleriaceae bacterium]